MMFRKEWDWKKQPEIEKLKIGISEDTGIRQKHPVINSAKEQLNLKRRIEIERIK